MPLTGPDNVGFQIWNMSKRMSSIRSGARLAAQELARHRAAGIALTPVVQRGAEAHRRHSDGTYQFDCGSADAT